MILNKEKKKNKNILTPNLSLIRPALFWDTSTDIIDWDQHKKSVIKRVFERGNEEEKNEIIRFYGKTIVESIIGNSDSGYRLPLRGKIK